MLIPPRFTQGNATQDRRLSSNWTGKLNILSMGIKSVHPLDEMDQFSSIKSTKSILSMLIAPQLHQIYTWKYLQNQLDWRLDSILYSGSYPIPPHKNT